MKFAYCNNTWNIAHGKETFLIFRMESPPKLKWIFNMNELDSIQFGLLCFLLRIMFIKINSLPFLFVVQSTWNNVLLYLVLLNNSYLLTSTFVLKRRRFIHILLLLFVALFYSISLHCNNIKHFWILLYHIMVTMIGLFLIYYLY